MSDSSINNDEADHEVLLAQEEDEVEDRPAQHPGGIVDLCTPPPVSRYTNTTNNASETNGSSDSDVQIIGYEQLTERPVLGRRLNRAESYNILEENNASDIEILGAMLELTAFPYQMQSPIENNSSYKCPICLDSVKLNSPVATECGHVFCYVCIRRSLSSVSHCPLCKTMISFNKLLRIFL